MLKHLPKFKVTHERASNRLIIDFTSADSSLMVLDVGKNVGKMFSNQEWGTMKLEFWN